MPDAQLSSSAPRSGPTRRGFLRGVGGAVVAGAVRPRTAPAAVAVPRVALSDAAVGLRHWLGVFPLAAAADLDGVEVDMGRLGNGPLPQTRFIDAAGRDAFADAAARAGVRIAALSLGAFAGFRFATDPRADAATAAWLDALVGLNVETGVLALGPADDLTDADTRVAVARRLRPLADKAANEGRTLVLNTPGPTDGLAALLDVVGRATLTAAVRLGPDAAAVFDRLGAERVGQLRWSSTTAGDAAAWSVAARRRTGRDEYWTVLDGPITSGVPLIDSYATTARTLRTTFA